MAPPTISLQQQEYYRYEPYDPVSSKVIVSPVGFCSASNFPTPLSVYFSTPSMAAMSDSLSAHSRKNSAPYAEEEIMWPTALDRDFSGGSDAVSVCSSEVPTVGLQAEAASLLRVTEDPAIATKRLVAVVNSRLQRILECTKTGTATVVRLQIDIRSGAFQEDYATAVGGNYRGSFHEFLLKACNMKVFEYRDDDVLHQLNPVAFRNESRVSLTDKATALATDLAAAKWIRENLPLAAKQAKLECFRLQQALNPNPPPAKASAILDKLLAREPRFGAVSASKLKFLVTKHPNSSTRML